MCGVREWNFVCRPRDDDWRRNPVSRGVPFHWLHNGLGLLSLNWNFNDFLRGILLSKVSADADILNESDIV